MRLQPRGRLFERRSLTDLSSTRSVLREAIRVAQEETMMMRRGVGRAIAVSLVTAFVSASGSARGAITIGAGPWIGTDTAGNVYFEEFQDWTAADCRALDGAGAAVGGRYNFNDGFDDSRDLIAFYSRDEGGNYYFRVDLYDLALGAENGNLDIYVAIDCASGGQEWMPDFTGNLHQALRHNEP
jgi:hypothetical protein